LDRSVKKWLAWVLWLVLPLACPASEIIAWKVPITRYLHRGMETDGMVRLKSAPESSPFFKAGDELWDIKGVAAANRMDDAPQVEWLVWNASSGRLVTKAEWISVWRFHQRLGIEELPRQCRLKASVFEVAPDGAPPSEAKPARHLLTWVTRSGMKFEAAQRSELGGMEVSGSVSLDELDPLAGLELHMTCSPRDQPKMDINCAVSMWSGTSLWLARDFDGKTGLDFMISHRIELIDGTPVEEAMMIQKGDESEPVKLDRKQMSRHRIGDKGWLAVQWLDPSQLLNWNGPVVPEEDPFAEKKPEEIRESLKLEEVSAPEEIHTWFSGPVWNVHRLVRNAGVISAEAASFAGYDPRSRCVFLFTTDVVDVDRFEQLFSWGCIRSPKHVEVGLDGRGQTRLITRSGYKSCLSRTADRNHSVRLFEIEPVIGEMDDILDLRLDYRDGPIDSPFEKIQSFVTMRSGESINALEAKSDPGAETTLRLKAEIKEAECVSPEP